MGAWRQILFNPTITTPQGVDIGEDKTHKDCLRCFLKSKNSLTRTKRRKSQRLRLKDSDWKTCGESLVTLSKPQGLNNVGRVCCTKCMISEKYWEMSKSGPKCLFVRKEYGLRRIKHCEVLKLSNAFDLGIAHSLSTKTCIFKLSTLKLTPRDAGSN